MSIRGFKQVDETWFRNNIIHENKIQNALLESPNVIVRAFYDGYTPNKEIPPNPLAESDLIVLGRSAGLNLSRVYLDWWNDFYLDPIDDIKESESHHYEIHSPFHFVKANSFIVKY
jgi:hypothetical protein